MKNIICFLTVNPNQLFYEFCKKLQTELSNNYEIYICIDDNSYDIPTYANDIKIIKINKNECEQNGFKSCLLSLNNQACSRDKALFYFCQNLITYNYIWFIEEDVFIPDLKTIPNLDEKYPISDLLCREHIVVHNKNHPDRNKWHWDHVYRQIKIEPPYAKSMICAIRCSKQMMDSINDYAKKYNNLFMDEALFNTLAIQNNLSVVNPIELSPIYWRNEWLLNDIKKDYLYHPIKDIQIQEDYRTALALNSTKSV